MQTKERLCKIRKQVLKMTTLVCVHLFYYKSIFDVFLTVHHSIDFSKYQLNAQFL